MNHTLILLTGRLAFDESHDECHYANPELLLSVFDTRDGDEQSYQKSREAASEEFVKEKFRLPNSLSTLWDEEDQYSDDQLTERSFNAHGFGFRDSDTIELKLKRIRAQMAHSTVESCVYKDVTTGFALGVERDDDIETV